MTGLIGYNKRRVDDPEEVSKRCAKKVSDGTSQKVARNLLKAERNWK